MGAEDNPRDAQRAAQKLGEEASWTDREDSAGRYAIAKVGGQTKYNSYVLPGGQNYREMLIRMPRKEFSTEDAAKLLFGKSMANLSEDERQQATDLMYDKSQRKSSSEFHSSHWEEPNILAHIRFNDRVVPARTDIDIPDVERRIMESLGVKDAKHLASGAPQSASFRKEAD